jgi:LmbE family N-acetylglucosaminyl deacetylase
VQSSLNRRDFLTNSLSRIGLLPLSSIFSNQQNAARSLKVVCVGAHPDDPETGCGGTLAKFSEAGHQLTIIYLTKGETGIPGKGPEETGAIRSEEARQACKILNAKPVFAGQINGKSLATNEWYIKMRQLLEAEKPDLIFTHWPIDSHKDHMVASVLTQKAYLEMGGRIPLYFYEVNAGQQTRNFTPTDFVDITDTQEQKRKAVFCHKSQGYLEEGFYQKDHGLMEDFRGLSIGAKAAEAFIRLAGPGSLI